MQIAGSLVQSCRCNSGRFETYSRNESATIVKRSGRPCNDPREVTEERAPIGRLTAQSAHPATNQLPDLSISYSGDFASTDEKPA